MQLSQLDTFSNAVPVMSLAFFEHDQRTFAVALKSAQDAVGQYPWLLAKLNQAAEAFPARHALELVLQVTAEVIELERRETRRRVIHFYQERRIHEERC